MCLNTITALAEIGQSIWLDNINRSMIESGKLREMLEQGLLGMTSNPTIFDNAIRRSNDYDEKLKEFYTPEKSTFDIYDDLTVKDIQDAADIFKGLYEKTDGLDGYVSLEVNPKLASDTGETLKEAYRLHKKVNRPNVMFKIPATDAGFPAIEELLGDGININATLIFSVEQYVKTANAYINGIEKLLNKTKDAKKVRSVASVFVSRIDTMIDKLIDEKLAKGEDKKLKSLKGRAAVANSSLLFKKYIEIFSGAKFKRLEEKGANIQRVLWASTSTKNPEYSDIKYVSELIGKGTINTLPDNTFKAFLEHGVVKESLTSNVREAEKIINGLRKNGIEINEICRKLLEDGVIAFENSFESLLASIEKKVENLFIKPLDSLSK